MPSFADWLRASWEDFRRRWAVLLAVAGTGGAATLAAGFLPFVPAGLATAFGVGPAWAVWGSAAAVSVIALLWFSAWTQAAMMRAAATDETARACLATAWGRTPAFGWVLSLVTLAVAGGYLLLIVPGLILTVALFAAPFLQISGEAEGTRALGLSWSRVRPHFGAVALRLLAAAALTAAPGWIPYVGWIVMMFWTPLAVVAMSRLEKDLRTAEPAAASPDWMGPALAGLCGVVLVAAAGGVFLAVRVAAAAATEFNRPDGLLSRVRPETAQSLLESLSGQGTDERKKKAYADLLNEIRGTP